MDSKIVTNAITSAVGEPQYKDFRVFYASREPGDYLIDQTGKIYLVARDRSVRLINNLIKNANVRAN